MNMIYVSYSVQNRIASICIDRAEKRNALNNALVEELQESFNKAALDPAVKVIVLKSEGKVFSAGADLAYLQQLQKNSYQENLEDSQQLRKLLETIYTLPKIVIAQVQGHAIAGGCGLMSVCDFAISVPSSKFGYTEVKIGFIPALVSVFLLRKINGAHAKELLLTGNLITAQRAKEIGLIYKIAETEELEDTVNNFAQEMAENTSGQSIQLSKALLEKIPNLSLSDGLQHAAELNAKARNSEDCKKGIASFLNKEKITW